jgi:serine/threonine-protein kinase
MHSGDQTYVRRFHREAQAAASLVHAHIVQIYEVGCIDGVHFIAQEYVAGYNLQQALTRSGAPELEVALSIMRQAAAALQKAAEQGIVHRDIKPENIMLTEHGEVKVADFGLARLRDEEAATNLTQAGFTMGTPLYMSPEQVEGRPLDPRSDIYSLGVTCYQMFSGQPPFRGDTALGVAVQHLQSVPVPLEQIRPDLPTEVCRIIHKMLAKNPSDRYETARALLQDLRALPQNRGGVDEEFSLVEHWRGETSATVMTRQTSVTQLAALMHAPAPPRPVSPRGVLLAVAAAVAVFAAGVGWSWFRQTPPITPTSVASRAPVERQKSAEAQYVYALFADTEDAWRSVSEYFPGAYFDLRAEQQLARIYMQQEDYSRAKPIFDNLEDLSDEQVRKLQGFGAPASAKNTDLESQFESFGLAGQAVVLYHSRKTEAALAKLAALYPQRQWLDGPTRGWIAQIIKKGGREYPDNKTIQEWDQWLNSSRGKAVNRGPAEAAADSPTK